LKATRLARHWHDFVAVIVSRFKPRNRLIISTPRATLEYAFAFVTECLPVLPRLMITPALAFCAMVWPICCVCVHLLYLFIDPKYDFGLLEEIDCSFIYLSFWHFLITFWTAHSKIEDGPNREKYKRNQHRSTNTKILCCRLTNEKQFLSRELCSSKSPKFGHCQ